MGQEQGWRGALSLVKWGLVHPAKEAGLHPGRNGALQASYGQRRGLSDLHFRKLDLAAAWRGDSEGRQGGE